MKIPCANCNNPVEVGEIPEPQITNTAGASVLLVEHPRRGVCLECKTDVAVALIGANLHLRAVPIPKQQAQSPIVLVPALPKNGRG